MKARVVDIIVMISTIIPGGAVLEQPMRMGYG
jgi:hypothetical protein